MLMNRINTLNWSSDSPTLTCEIANRLAQVLITRGKICEQDRRRGHVFGYSRQRPLKHNHESLRADAQASVSGRCAACRKAFFYFLHAVPPDVQ